MATTPSPMMPFGSSTPPQPPPAAVATMKKLRTGRKILVYPPGALPAAIKSLSNRTSLKQSSIASVNDLGTNKIASARDFFAQSTDPLGLTFDELDVIVVKDMHATGGFTPASVGGSGQMPIIGDEHYVVPVMSVGLSGQLGALSADDLKKIQDQLQLIQNLLQLHTASDPTQIPQQPAAAGSQQTWGVNAVQALTSKFTGKGIRVAVIDTGIDPSHPDLAGKIDGAWSFDNGAVNDDIGHGTHVAGTITGSRTLPIAYGMAPDARLYIAKVFRGDGTGGTDSDVIGAINWAIKSNCQIANMSLSTSVPLPQGTRYDPAFEQIAQNALKKNLLLVAAAGNCADMNDSFQNTGTRNNPPAPVGHPANCPSVLAVGALTQDLQIAAFSNAGQADPSNGQITFAAPGVFILSSWPTNMSIPTPMPGVTGSYNIDQGTSMASPHIAGLAALLAEKLGGIGGLQLWQALAIASINPLTGLSKPDIGFGMLLAEQS